MRKISAVLIVLFAWIGVKAQSPVIITQPYKFQKYVHVAGSLFSDSTLLNTDSTNRAATTAWVKRNGGTSGSFLFDSNFRVVSDSVHLAHIVSIDSNLNVRAVKAPWYDNTTLTLRADVGLASSNTFKSIDVFNNLYAVGPSLANDWRYKHNGRANVLSLSGGAMSYQFAPFGAASSHAVLTEPFRVDTALTIIKYVNGSDSTAVSVAINSFDAFSTDGSVTAETGQNPGSTDQQSTEISTGNTSFISTNSVSGGGTGFTNSVSNGSDARSITSQVGGGSPPGVIISDGIDHNGLVGDELFTVSGDPNQYLQFGNAPSGGGNTIYSADDSIHNTDRQVSLNQHFLGFLGGRNADFNVQMHDPVSHMGLEQDNEASNWFVNVTDTTNSTSAQASVSTNITTQASEDSVSQASSEVGSLGDQSFIDLGVADVSGTPRKAIHMETVASGYQKGIVATDGIDEIGYRYGAANYGTNGKNYNEWIPDWGTVKTAIDSAGTFSRNIYNIDGSTTDSTRTATIIKDLLFNEVDGVTGESATLSIGRTNGIDLATNVPSVSAAEIKVNSQFGESNAQMNYSDNTTGNQKGITISANGLKIIDQIDHIGADANEVFPVSAITQYAQYAKVDSIAIAKADSVKGTIPGGGTTTHPLTFNNSGTGDASGSTFDGSAAKTLSYNSIGAQPQLSGTGFVKASGTSISYDNSTYITGNQTITFTPTGDVTGSTTGTTSLTPALVIGAGKVTNTMLAGSIAFSKLIGTDITTVGTLVAGSIPYSLLTGTPSSLPPSGTAGGELAGLYPNPTLLNSAVIGKVLTGYTSGSGTVASTDNILQAIQKLNGNDGLKAPIASPTFTGTVTIPNGGVFGTPASMTATNVTGLPTTALTGVLQAAQFPALTGDITTVSGALATTLKNTGTSGTYGQVTTDAQGRVSSGQTVTDLAHGGTGSATQNFVDISTNQSSIAGTKGWTGLQTYGGGIKTSGNISAAAWGLNGVNTNISAANYTDNSTGSGATVTNNMVNTFAVPTLIASNTSVTYTNAATVYIDGAPTAGTNVTIGTPYALLINGNVAPATTNSYLLGNAAHVWNTVYTSQFNSGSQNSFTFRANGTSMMQAYNTAHVSIGTTITDDGVTSHNLQVYGSEAIVSTQTSVNGSTSGTAAFQQPISGGSLRIVTVNLASLVGTASYTFPVAFTNTPVVLSSSGLATSIVTSLSTTAMTCTGATTSGTIIVMGY